MEKQPLIDFLLEANQAGYSTGDEKKWVKEDDKSTTISFVKNDWRMHDNFFGGEPYGGRLVVFHQDKPVWMMIYYGFVAQNVATDQVYKILRSALKLMPKEYPFRGPKELIEDGYVYQNSWNGEVNQYSGEEKIFFQDKMIYQANYMGGFVDQRGGV